MRWFSSLLLLLALAGLGAGQMNAQRGGGTIGVGISPHAASGFARTLSPSPLQSPRLVAPAPGSFSHSAPAAWPLNGPVNQWPVRTPGMSHGQGEGHHRDHDRGYGQSYFSGTGTYLFPNIVGYPVGFGYAPVADDFNADQQGTPDQNQSAANPQAGGPEPVPGAASPGAASPGASAPGISPEDQQQDYVQPGPPPLTPPLSADEQPSSRYRPAYQGSMSEEVHAQPATTLILKDGKPSTQVHNYVLTSSTLYALDDGARSEIPISEIDVPATIAANRTAGVDFSLPASR
jgi:hypothetical protein